MHIAQLNIARLLAPIDDPRMSGFVDRLDEINGLAERGDGFVWRLKDESGSATNIQVFDDPLIIVNMSVWESIEHLRQYTYFSRHIEPYRQRGDWFERPDEAHLVLWWIQEDHTPTLQEGLARLELLRREGPTERAFTMKKAFAPGGPDSGTA